MKIVFAPDSFKGTLSATRIVELLAQSAKQIFPESTFVGIPIADGGEGTVDAIVPIVKGNYCTIQVQSAMGTLVNAAYGILNNQTALIEMAAASGLTLIEPRNRNVMLTSTYGTGQLIAHALENGYRKLHIAIGGSATNDGGIGCAAALGVRFLDNAGNELEPVAANLIKIADIDISAIHPAISESEFIVMCDVNNPLIGNLGATYVFGPQKGAGPNELLKLESGMRNYAKVIKERLGIDIATIAGAGAAGGLGAGLMVFMNARLKSGIESVLEIINFESIISDANLVITGEGKMDHQSLFGKVPSGIGYICKKNNIPVIAIVGGIEKGTKEIYQCGIESVISTISSAMNLETALEHAEELFLEAADRMFRFLKVGMNIKSNLD